MATYQFLSDDWFVAVSAILDEAGHEVEVVSVTEVVMNLVVTETPFGEDRHVHVGTREGRAGWGRGHTDDADLTLTTDYVTAREVFLSADVQAGLRAFMEGRVKVQGDLTKLFAAQLGAAGGAGGPGAGADQGSAGGTSRLAESFAAITE